MCPPSHHKGDQCSFVNISRYVIFNRYSSISNLYKTCIWLYTNKSFESVELLILEDLLVYSNIIFKILFSGGNEIGFSWCSVTNTSSYFCKRRAPVGGRAFVRIWLVALVHWNFKVLYVYIHYNCFSICNWIGPCNIIYCSSI